MVFTLFFAGLGFSGIDQVPPPGGQDGDQPVPLSSGLAVITFLGLGFGVKKLYDARKKYKVN